jgi:hypothetical protein
LTPRSSRRSVRPSPALVQRVTAADVIARPRRQPFPRKRVRSLTRNGRRGNPSSSSVLCEGVRYLSGVGHAARIAGNSLALGVTWQFNGTRRSRWLLALLLASQGFQKFFGQEGLDQDRDTLRRNRVHRLRSDVAGHHDGVYVPAKGGTQVPNGLDTIR